MNTELLAIELHGMSRSDTVLWMGWNAYGRKMKQVLLFPHREEESCLFYDYLAKGETATPSCFVMSEVWI